jgi:hypothetical protein
MILFKSRRWVTAFAVCSTKSCSPEFRLTEGNEGNEGSTFVAFVAFCSNLPSFGCAFVFRAFRVFRGLSGCAVTLGKESPSPRLRVLPSD